MNAPEKFLLPDVQAVVDTRSIPIDRVGETAVVHPLRLRMRSGEVQTTVVTADMHVGLWKDAKGTQMSRFREILQSRREPLDAEGFRLMMDHITIASEVRSGLWIEDLVAIAEEEASCQVYGLIKRPDEKWVTERSYDNPKFVEDLVRDIALRLNADDRVLAYVVESENFESIHDRSSCALIEHDKRVVA